MNRRKILQGAIGVAAAGPGMAKQAMASAVASTNLAPLPRLYHGEAASPKVDPAWFNAERERLERHARGDLTPEELEATSLKGAYGDTAHEDINALRSVAPTTKARLHTELQAKREREMRMSYAARELCHLLKAWGVS